MDDTHDIMISPHGPNHMPGQFMDAGFVHSGFFEVFSTSHHRAIRLVFAKYVEVPVLAAYRMYCITKYQNTVEPFSMVRYENCEFFQYVDSGDWHEFRFKIFPNPADTDRPELEDLVGTISVEKIPWQQEGF